MTATTAMRTKNTNLNCVKQQKTCEYFYRCDNLLYRAELHMFCIRRFVVCLLFSFFFCFGFDLMCSRTREPFTHSSSSSTYHTIRIQCVRHKSVAAITFQIESCVSIWSRGVLDFVQFKRTCEKETIFSSSFPNRAFQQSSQIEYEKQQFGSTIKI